VTHALRSLAAALFVVLPVTAGAQQAPAPIRDEPVVVTAGDGVVQAIPDRAWVSVTAESRAGSPRDAQKKNADAMKPVQDRLRAAGIPDGSIRTIEYDLQPDWEYTGNQRVLRGYVARNTIEVRVDSVDRIGELLDLVVSAGATSVGGVRFDLKDRPRLEREALRLAVADARARAEAAASGAGRTIDRILRIEEQGVSSPPPVVFRATLAAEQRSGEPPIASGQIEVRAHVTLTSILK
jgi:uncharacterized protein YggE